MLLNKRPGYFRTSKPAPKRKGVNIVSRLIISPVAIRASEKLSAQAVYPGNGQVVDPADQYVLVHHAPEGRLTTKKLYKRLKGKLGQTSHRCLSDA